MSANFRGVVIDNPNMTLLSEQEVPYGVMLDVSHLVNQVMDPAYFNQGQGLNVRDLYLPNFAMRISEGTLAYDLCAVNQKGVGSTIPASCLFYEGRFTSQRKGQNIAKNNGEGEQNFIFDPNTEEISYCKANQFFQNVHISIAPEYFESFLPDDEDWSVELKNKMSKAEYIKGATNPIITTQQRQAIESILTCPVEGKLGWHMRESLLMQVVMLQLHMLFQKQETKEESKIRKMDQRLMHEVKNYLNSTFAEDHSLTSLAKYFGINQHKLTTNFKLLFGVSVFDYIALLKMDYAKRLLEKEGMLVNEVAPKVGYKNPHHFATAFKKKFGVSPSSVRG